MELDSLVGEFTESPVLIFNIQNRNTSMQMRENVSRRIFNVREMTNYSSGSLLRRAEERRLASRQQVVP